MLGGKLMIYGAYGYTAKLIIPEMLKKGLRPILSGRDEAKLREVSKEFGLEYVSINLSDNDRLLTALEKVELVVHCAGPFVHTAEAMAQACLKCKTHYIDITGEYNVFDLMIDKDHQAKEAGVMLLPGAGFDVVPSDCLANQLKDIMPDAVSLELAFTTKGGRLSRGTAKTMVENVDKGHLIREQGNYEKKSLGSVTKEINYGPFKQISVGISWGDISTAHFSTGIKNIIVYTGTDDKQLKSLRTAHRLRGLLGLGFVKRFIQKQIDKKPAGPSLESRKRSETYLWGKITNTNGSKELRLKVPNGYDLTASAVVLISQKILNGNYSSGFQTPASAYGKDLIFELEGCEQVAV